MAIGKCFQRHISAGSGGLQLEALERPMVQLRYSSSTMPHRSFTGGVHAQLCPAVGSLSHIRYSGSSWYQRNYSSKDDRNDVLGEPSTPSFVLLPLSGYSSIGPVQILDWTGNAAASFNLNATKGQNTVLVQAPVTSAFGKDDVRSVNLTIVDPSGRPVPNAVNIPFSQIPPVSQPQQTYPYVADWTYPSNLSEGNYQVWIDVVDIQGNIAYSLHGPSGLGLFTPGMHPLDLIPYVVGAAGGTIAGTFYIKRRRRKEYLAPFDHFYSLTGGSFPQGTMVTVEGNTGAGKTLLTEQLMYDDLKTGRPCVFVSTADFPGKIRSGMRSLGLETEPYESKESLKFVDSYSMAAGQPSQEKFYASSSGDLTSLCVKISPPI